MTKQEAIDLETKIDDIFSKATGKICQCSMALTGAFSVSFGENFVNINKYDLQSPDWVHYIGDYDELMDYISAIQKTIRENSEDVKLLLESYNMRID